MIEVHLASVCQTQAPNIYTLCLKCPTQPNKVLPILTTGDQVGVIQGAQLGRVPPNLLYNAFNRLLTQDDFYIAAIQIELMPEGERIRETGDGGQYVTLAGIVRQKNSLKGEWKSEPIYINAAEGIAFAYMFDYPIVISSELLRTAINIDDFFNEQVSRDEFVNDILQNRREPNERPKDRTATAQGD